MITHILAFGLMVFAVASNGFGWAHQGHILITRLAALEIINDPAAPQGLKDFLKANMPHTLDQCQALAEKEKVGMHPEEQAELYGQGLDKWCTMPDQIRSLPEGQVKIEPFGTGEAAMHFLDMEAFGPQFFYKDDLSCKPDINKIPHDPTDPRWKLSGYAPLRIEQEWTRLRDAIGKGDAVAQPDEAVKLAGFLAHYEQDITQPHHATRDFKSLTYLCGHLAGMPPVATPENVATLRAPQGVDPHGDIEFQLFENTDKPRADFRVQYWKLLQDDLKTTLGRLPEQGRKFDPFHGALETLSDSYDYLPYVGRATQAAYAGGSFDPAAYFGFTGETHGQKIKMIELIALQNAKAVRNTEHAWREAWIAAHEATKGHE